MKTILTPAVILLALGTLPGCYYDVEEDLHGSVICDTTAATYSGNVLRILETNCYTCHSGGLAQGGIILEGYDNLKVYATNGKLEGSISHTSGFSPMPKNAGKLDDCSVGAIRQWIADGAPNN